MKATFAAGCFWKVELAFKDYSTRVGYCGGTLKNPTYEQVCTGKTGHAESVEIEGNFNYRDLLDIFFKIHDPTTLNCQGPDIGTQYRSVIFYHTKEQHDLAVEYKKKDPKIVTFIEPAGFFYPAEKYHQKYLFKK